MTLELHAGVRLTGNTKLGKEILERAIATGLIASVVFELAVKESKCYIGFSDKMASTNAERANAVCHVAAIARELGVSDCRVAFDSYSDWLKGIGLREENGEVKGL